MGTYGIKTKPFQIMTSSKNVNSNTFQTHLKKYIKSILLWSDWFKKVTKPNLMPSQYA